VRATAYHAGRRLDERELHPPRDSCPLCLSHGVRPSLHRIQEAPLVELLA